jgi:DNA-binding winged helix-turn-helix (wHTH) protein/tetratricopeptide (TPR) repeat protein
MPQFSFGAFVLDDAQQIVTSNEATLPLTAKEVALLQLLLDAAPRVVSRDELSSRVWPDTVVSEGSMSTLVYSVRKKLTESGGDSDWIETVPRRGFRFTGAVARTSGESAGNAVAVLRFAADTADQQYAADVVADDLIASLVRRGVRNVLARGSSLKFSSTEDISRIAHTLQAAHLVLGRFVASDLLRIELVTNDGRLVWSLDIDPRRQLGEAASQLASGLLPFLGTSSPAAAATGSPAHEEYAQARHLWNRRPSPDVWTAIDLFRRATAKDPRYAPAWVGLADAFATLGSWEAGVLPPREAFTRAREYALRALDADPDSAEARNTLAYVALHHDWHPRKAAAKFAEVVHQSPSLAAGRHWYSHALVALRRFDEALEQSHEALRLDPANPIVQVHFAWHHFMTGELELALDHADRVISSEPALHWGHYFRGITLDVLGEGAASVAALETASRLSGDDLVMLAGLARALAGAGADEQAERYSKPLVMAQRERGLFAYELSLVALARGHRERALELLDEARLSRSAWLAYLDVEPRLATLRGSAEFGSLRERVLGSEGSPVGV